MKVRRRKHVYAAVTGFAIIAVGVFGNGVSGRIAGVVSDISSPPLSFSRGTTSVPVLPEKLKVTHMATPASVRAIYMSQCVVGTPSFRSDLVKLIDTTELNAVVIDIKDYTGKISFTPDDTALKDSVSDACGARDMKEFIRELHEKNIYVIGRITVFQDPYYTALHPELAVKKLSSKETNWKDGKGLSFIDVSTKPFWEYIVKISNASYDIGFDELNFDYIRFPSDGNMKDIFFPWSDGMEKSEALERFYIYLHEQLRPTGVVMSVDLFGMVTTNYDDLNIGQILERAMPYFDFIDPMVYPSHYPTGFNGYKKVNEHSYDIVHFSLTHAVARTIATSTSIAGLAFERIGTTTPAIYRKPSYPASQIRPWLQSFDYPVTYTPEMVSAQIKANTDAGLDSYLFWDPANKYRSLRAVLKPE
jgi:hypothetical protein